MQGTRSTFNSRVTIFTGRPTASTSASIHTSATKRTRSTRSSPARLPKAEAEEESAVKNEEAVKEEEEKKPKKPTKPRAPPKLVTLAKPHPEPKRWREAYEIIRKQREGIEAPVDTMGCSQGGLNEGEVPTNEKNKRLSIFVSLILSPQTKDPVTHAAMGALHKGLKGGLCLEAFLETTVEEIDRLICKVGFHETKAKNLKLMAVRARDLHEGDIPSDLPSLLAFNGVGPKIAILYLQAIGINNGIGVDTHVHRITNRLGWHKPETSTAEKTRANLESWLPKPLHPEINLMLVGFGQTICLPVGPRCDLCDVAKVTPKLCPSRQTVAKKRSESASPLKKKRKIEEGLEDEELAKPKIEVKVEREEEVVEENVRVDGSVKAESVEESNTVEIVKVEPLNCYPFSPGPGATIYLGKPGRDCRGYQRAFSFPDHCWRGKIRFSVGCCGISSVLFLQRLLRFLRPSKLASSSASTQRPPLNAKGSTGNDKDSRPFGVWSPVAWDMPPVPPLEDFSVTGTPPVPYRPFKWNSYPINMGIRPMPWTTWLQLDDLYPEVLKVRQQRTDTQGKLVNDTRPGFRPHALEALCEIASFLALRYPACFEVKRTLWRAEDPATYGDSVVGEKGGAVIWIKNLITDKVYDFAEIEKIEGKDWDPIKIAGLLVEDDLAIMVENRAGEYLLQSGSICTAGTWRLTDKMGQTLDMIHARGGVVGWADKLKFSMERFFQRIAVDKPVQRNNFWIQSSGTLPWAETSGPESAWDDQKKRPDPELLKVSENPSWTPTTRIDSAEGLWLRNERQTLRRLSRSGGVLFTIRTYLVPIPAVAAEPGAPGRLASSLRSWTPELQKYKGAGKYLPVLLEYLDTHHQSQVANGSVHMVDGEVEVGQQKPYPF